MKNVFKVLFQAADFNQRMIKRLSAGFILITIYAIFMATFVFSDPYEIVSFHTLNYCGFIVFTTSWILTIRNRIKTAGLLLIGFLIISNIGLAVISRITNSANTVNDILAIMMIPVCIPLVLTSKYILPLTAITVAIVSAINFAIPITDETIEYFLVQSRVEFLFPILAMIVAWFIYLLSTEMERRAQSAEAANAAKTQFLRIVNHELRTPLNSMLPMLNELIRRDNNGEFVTGELNPVQYEFLKRTQQGGQQLLIIVQDVLTASHMDTGNMQIAAIRQEIASVLLEVANSANILVFHKRDKVSVQLSMSDNLPIISIDRTAIRHILLNLLSNAVKFTKEGHITLKAYTTADSVRISVSDTGQGIAQENHANLFDPWQQAVGGRVQGEGSGLGLYIANQFVQAHNGQIWMESALGFGTSFYIVLPL